MRYCVIFLSLVLWCNITLHYKYSRTFHDWSIPPLSYTIIWRGHQWKHLSLDSPTIAKHVEFPKYKFTSFVKSQRLLAFTCFFLNSSQIPLKYLKWIRLFFKKHQNHHSRVVVNKPDKIFATIVGIGPRRLVLSNSKRTSEVWVLLLKLEFCIFPNWHYDSLC